MILVLGWCMWALAQPPATLGAVEVTPEGFRASYDLTVFVRRDGNLYVEDALLLDADVARELERLAQIRGGEVRVVVSADPDADWSRVVAVLDLVQAAGLGRVALEVGQALPADDPLFPGKQVPGGARGTADPGVVDLDEDEYVQGFAQYQPKLHKFPQNPYGSTDFTAYTREFGEAKLGITSLTYGVLPRIHLGTSPLLDALGAYNFSGKGNFLRLGPYDAALSASVFVVPITELLRTLDPDGRYKIAGYKVKDEQLFVKQFTTVTFQLLNSLQLVGGWSVHAGVSYTRASARGRLDFRNLPVVVLPGGANVGGDLTVVPGVIGELVDVRFATDYRFNRRDSLIFQFAAPVWGSARGELSADLQELPKEAAALRDLDLSVRYSRFLSLTDGYRSSLAWQFSWHRVDLRFGLGFSAISRSWMLQAFDLSYRLGGNTRRTQGAILKQYRREQKAQGILEDIEFELPVELEEEGEGDTGEDLPE
jgi:hypothetical protein